MARVYRVQFPFIKVRAASADEAYALAVKTVKVMPTEMLVLGVEDLNAKHRSLLWRLITGR